MFHRLSWAKEFGFFLRTKEPGEGVKTGIQEAGKPQCFNSVLGTVSTDNFVMGENHMTFKSQDQPVTFHWCLSVGSGTQPCLRAPKGSA